MIVLTQIDFNNITLQSFINLNYIIIGNMGLLRNKQIFIRSTAIYANSFEIIIK